MTKLIFGCGYLGSRVAKLWRRAGETVYAVTRGAARTAEFTAAGLKPIVADVTDIPSLHQLPAADSVLYAIGYDRTAGPTMHDVYVEGLRNALDALPDATGRIIYVSSTGVYGQTDGEWIDEDSACRPMRESGRVCLEAEELLRRHPRWRNKSIILRLAGIYGPGRIPRQESLRASEPIAAPSEGWLNLIHVDDAAAIVSAAERMPPPRLYNVSDGQPPQRHEYYTELAGLLGAPLPKFIEPDTRSPAAMRAESNKRVSNHRMLTELHVELAYPSYREGLAAILEGDH